MTKKNVSTKKRLILGGSIFLTVALLFSLYWFFILRYIESTDDAYTRSDFSVISPKVTGYIQAIHVRDNQHVKKGQPLLKIDDKDFIYQDKLNEALIAEQESSLEKIRIQLLQQIKTIDEAKADVEKTKVMLEQTRKNYERSDKLLSEGFVTNQRYDDDKAKFLSAKADFDKAKAILSVAQTQEKVLKATFDTTKAQLSQAVETYNISHYNLQNTIVYAPFDGVIGNKSAQIGQLVRTGMPLMTLVPSSATYVVANFKETQITHMKPGQKAKMKIDAYPDITIEGTIDSLAPATGAQFSLLPPENATGNFTKIIQRVPVKIVIQQTDKVWDFLRPGLSVVVSIDTHHQG